MKKTGEESDESGEIETKTVEEVKAEPYNMPAGFEWCHMDVMDAAEAEVRVFLLRCYYDDGCGWYLKLKIVLFTLAGTVYATHRTGIWVRSGLSRLVLACILSCVLRVSVCVLALIWEAGMECVLC